MLVRMAFAHLRVDPISHSPAVELVDQLDRSLCVPIGLPEARAIATGLGKIELLRPHTHALMNSMLAETGAKLVSVELLRVHTSTPEAKIQLRQGDRRIVLSARASDALALALLSNTPIMVDSEELAGGPLAPILRLVPEEPALS